MSMNICCFNSKCKFYHEDFCEKNYMGENIQIGETGMCETFTEGISDLYNVKLYEENTNADYKKAKYIKWHNNYDDVLTIGNEYDIHGEKDEWLYIQDDRGGYQYYRKDCFEILN